MSRSLVRLRPSIITYATRIAFAHLLIQNVLRILLSIHLSIDINSICNKLRWRLLLFYFSSWCEKFVTIRYVVFTGCQASPVFLENPFFFQTFPVKSYKLSKFLYFPIFKLFFFSFLWKRLKMSVNIDRRSTKVKNRKLSKKFTK